MLAVGSHFDNHLFYAGHLLELMSFALLLGFEVPTIYRAAAVLCRELDEPLYTSGAMQVRIL